MAAAGRPRRSLCDFPTEPLTRATQFSRMALAFVECNLPWPEAFEWPGCSGVGLPVGGVDNVRARKRPRKRTAHPDRRERFLVGSSLLAATVLYLVTNNPLIAAILPCLHGSWNTARTGLWLLKTDPCRSRARIRFAFYVAAACWKAAGAALGTVMVFILVERFVGLPPNMDELAAIMIVLAGGTVLNTLLGLAAVGAASGAGFAFGCTPASARQPAAISAWPPD